MHFFNRFRHISAFMVLSAIRKVARAVLLAAHRIAGMYLIIFIVTIVLGVLTQTPVGQFVAASSTANSVLDWLKKAVQRLDAWDVALTATKLESAYATASLGLRKAMRFTRPALM
ncbi:hypothetical protein ACFQ36_07035 [Arthrobacter sp. GCM10027362]|uniref:hypothetical protein n=1 Tax=Arthrobacter sp. GCM10027362 TaxID=3273379 RepID=UPI00363D6981